MTPISMRGVGATLCTGAAIFRVKTAEDLQYRAAWLSGAMTSVFWGLIEVTVYRVFFMYANSRAAVNTAALTLPQMITYVWLAQVLFIMAPHSVDGEILNKLNSGDIGVELCRPLDLYVHWFAKTAASRVVPLFWRGLPVLLVGLILPAGWRISGPASAGGLVLMLLSCVNAVFLCTAFGMLVVAVRVNVRWGDGPMHIILLAGSVFSGAYLPLQLWPDVLQRFLLWQPFAGYLDIPLRLYLGTMPLSEALVAMGFQIGWAMLFVVAGQAILHRRLKETIVQGG